MWQVRVLVWCGQFGNGGEMFPIISWKPAERPDSLDVAVGTGFFISGL